MRKKSKITSVISICLFLFACIPATTFAQPLKTPILKARSEDQRTTISWTPVENAAGYQVYQLQNSSWVLAATCKGNKNFLYTRKGANPRRKEVYKVRAYSECRGGPFSKKLKVANRIKMPVITGIRKKKITWQKMPSADYYTVYVKKSGRWKRLGKTKKTYFKGRFYRKKHYTVTAWNKIQHSRFDTTFSNRFYGYKNWHRKKVLIDGDSISSPSYSWSNRTANLFGIKAQNKSRPGKTVAYNNTTPSNSLLYNATVNKCYKNFKLLIFNGGTNDYSSNCELGDITSKDARTYYGAWNRILSKARNDNPKAKIVIVTPIERKKLYDDYTLSGYETPNSAGCTLLDYGNASQKIAEKYNCFVYDSKEAGVVNKTALSRYMLDNVHPCSLLHVKMSDDFAEYLKQYVL